MAEPILASNGTWFTQGGTTVTRADITEIEIMDSYTPDSSVTVTDSWDASAALNGSVMCYVIGTKLIIAGNGSGKVFLNEESRDTFGSYTNNADAFVNVTTFTNATLLDPSKCINIWRIFGNMRSVKSIDVSGWNMKNATSIGQIFADCRAMTTVNVSGWKFPKAIMANNLFGSCRALEEIDLSTWELRNMSNLSSLFYYCESLKNIKWGIVDTSSCTNMSYMFHMCFGLETVDVSVLNTSSVTDMSYMFGSCTSLKTLNLSNFDFSKVQSIEGMFFTGPSDTSSLETLILPENFKLPVVASRSFEGAVKLKGFNVSDWETSACTNMSFMFYDCSSLKEIDVSNWDVSKVTNFDHFAAHANLKRKGIENWKTTSATNMNALFHNCAEEELDLSGWDVSKNQFFCQMFENSPNLKRIKGLEKWNTSAGLGFDGMFERCSKLEEVDLSSFDTTKAKNGTSASANGHTTATLSNMFLSCNNLKKVKVGPNFAINGDGSNTTAANKAILPTPSTTYIEGADGNWYNFIGESFAPNGMKDKTAETYYASYDIVADMDVVVKNGSLIDTAKAIREKNGTTNKYAPAEFGTAIRALT